MQELFRRLKLLIALNEYRLAAEGFAQIKVSICFLPHLLLSNLNPYYLSFFPGKIRNKQFKVQFLVLKLRVTPITTVSTYRVYSIKN